MTRDRIRVPFAGDGCGVEELSWGQLEIWRAMQKQGGWLPIGFTRREPPGATIAGIVDELRFYLCRYQSMRTRLRFAEDGRVQQVVAAEGTLDLEVFDVGDEDPARVAAEVEGCYRAGGIDYVTDWPVRVAVVRQNGRPTHLVMVACHLVSDGFGALTMMDELAARDPETGRAAGPVTAMEPMAQARWQRSPAGQRQTDLAMRYWAKLLYGIAPRRFGDSDDERVPRHWTAEFESPAMYLATRAIAARTRLDSSYVLLAGCAVALARVTGVNPVVIRVVVSNRFRPGLARTVSPINQTGLCVIDVADAIFDEVLLRTWRQAMGCYKYAYYDPDRLAGLLEQVNRDRGEEIDVGCFFNDRRLRTRQDDGNPPPTAGQVRSARCGTLSWNPPSDLPVERFFLHIDDVPDTVRVTHNADTRFFPPGHMEAFLRGMEEALVAAALDPGAATRVRCTPGAPPAAVPAGRSGR